MAEDSTFAEGFLFKTRANQPSYVVGRLSVKIDEAIPFLKQHQKDGWVNLEIKIARSGNPYIVLDTFRKSQEAPDHAASKELPPEQADPDLTPSPESGGSDDLPF